MYTRIHPASQHIRRSIEYFTYQIKYNIYNYKRLEREERKVRVEGEHLTKEIEEAAERKRRELEKAELEQLM